MPARRVARGALNDRSLFALGGILRSPRGERVRLGHSQGCRRSDPPRFRGGKLDVLPHRSVGLTTNHEREYRMNHVYEGKPDGRQADTAIQVSRFRPKYRALSDDEKALHDALKDKAAEIEALYAKVKP